MTGGLLSEMANCHKDSKGKTFTPADFNPTLTKTERNRDALLITDDNVELMRDEFKRSISCNVKLTKIGEDDDG